MEIIALHITVILIILLSMCGLSFFIDIDLNKIAKDDKNRKKSHKKPIEDYDIKDCAHILLTPDGKGINHKAKTFEKLIKIIEKESHE